MIWWLIEDLQHCVSATSSLHIPVFTIVHIGLCSEEPTRWAHHQYKLGRAPWSPDSWNSLLQPTSDPPILSSCNTQCASTCSFRDKNSASHECIHVTNWSHRGEIRKNRSNGTKLRKPVLRYNCCPLNYDFLLQTAFVNQKNIFNWFRWILSDWIPYTNWIF